MHPDTQHPHAPASNHIHVCARCSVEHVSATAYPPPGWVWRGSRLYCDGCCSLVSDPVDDAAPSPPEPRRERQPEPAFFMLASGTVMNLCDPDPLEIRIADIALGLSRLCRFAGHTRRFYSVAEHCVRVSHLVPPHAALAALLHDASEAYLGDVTRPLKAVLPAYRQIERRMERAIDQAFGIDSHIWRVEIKSADLRMCIIEAHRLMPRDPAYWGTAPDERNIAVECWSPDEARRRFLDRFTELTRAAAPQQEAA